MKESSTSVKVLVFGLVLLAGYTSGIWYFWPVSEPPPNATSRSSGATVPDAQETRTDAPLENLQHAQGEVKVNPQDGLKYVWIPPVTFQMGCSPGDIECFDEEKPQHRVTITKGFWMGQTKVTARAYKRFAKATRRHTPVEFILFEGRLPNPELGDEAMPVVNVSWEDAQLIAADGANTSSGGHLKCRKSNNWH